MAGINEFMEAYNKYGREGTLEKIEEFNDFTIATVKFKDKYVCEFKDYGSDILIFKRVRNDDRFENAEVYLQPGESVPVGINKEGRQIYKVFTGIVLIT